MNQSLWNLQKGCSSLPTAKLSQCCSKHLLGKLRLERELEGHLGCTNAVSWNQEGNILLSGSDDLTIRFWEWQSGRQLLKISPGHRNNIFQAYALPHSNDSTILSCAADGQVRVSMLAGDGTCTSRKVGSHSGRAHKLSLLPENPANTFLSTGEDGVVMSYDLRAKLTGPVSKLLVSGGLRQPPVELNAVHSNPCRPWLFAVGGGDPYTRIFDIRKMSEQQNNTPCSVAKLCPEHLSNTTSEPVHITCVRYNQWGELLATYNDEDIYLFSAAGSGCQGQPIAVTTQGPSHSMDKSDDEEEDAEAQLRDNDERRSRGAQAQTSVQTATRFEEGESKDGEGGSIWQQRRQKELEDHVQQRYSGHRNSQTVKGVNFFGASDEYVISGSDCGHIFVWRKADGELMRLFKGDSWVVNCLEGHPYQPLVLATSGIENSIKIWSPTAEEVKAQDEDVKKRVLEENRSRRLRAARRVVIPPQMLLALLTGREETRARSRARNAEEGAHEEDSDGEESQSSEGEGQELAEGVMMARLRRLLLQRAYGSNDMTVFEAEAPGSDDDEQDEEDEEDSDENLPWNRLSDSGIAGSSSGQEGSCGIQDESDSDEGEEKEPSDQISHGQVREGGRRGGEGSSREGLERNKRAKPNDG